MKERLANIIKLSTPIFEHAKVEGIKINYTKSSGVHEGGAIPVDNAEKYVDLGLSFADEISFFREINDAISAFFSDENIFNKDNTFQLLINKDLTYSFDHFFDDSLDSSREVETRSSIGDELYEKFEQQRKGFKTKEESLSISLDEMNKGQLLGLIHHKLNEELEGIEWLSLILKTEIYIDENTNEKSIATYFYYSSSIDEEVEFDPKDPITSMNAISHIRDKMEQEGNAWDKSEITIHRNGEVDFKF